MRTIRAKLLTAVVTGLVCILVASLISIFILRGLAKEFDDVIKNELQARQDVNFALNQFKTQVQEWKNILIRGNDQKQFDKYVDKFNNQEVIVQQKISELATRTYLSPDVRNNLLQFKKTHQELGKQYRDSLQTFKASNFNTQIGDDAVRGIDRPAAKLLNQITEQINTASFKQTQILSDKKDKLIVYTILSLGIITLLIIVVLLSYIQKNITSPIKQSLLIANQIATGNLKNNINGHNRDEIGHLLLALNKMQSNLNESNNQLENQIKEQKEQAQVNGRIKQALDNVAAPVMLCNVDEEIIYLNDQCSLLLQKYTEQITHLQPLFSIKTILNENIETLLSNQSKWHDIKTANSQQIHCDIQFESIIFSLVASPVFNEENVLMGIVYEFSDQTELRKAQSSVDTIIKAAKAGELSKRIKADGLTGFMNTLALGINQMLDAIVTPIEQTSHYLLKIAEGEIPKNIEGNYQGDFKEIKQSLQQSTHAVSQLINDTKLLADAASSGQLSIRVDASEHKGDYQVIVNGINRALDELIKPINITSHYLDNISKGQVPTEIKEQFNGDFIHVKTSLEMCCRAIQHLINDTHSLVHAATNGELTKRADESLHQGDFCQIIAGINQTLDAITEPLYQCQSVIQSLSEGKLTEQINGEYRGDFASLKNAVNTSVANLAELVSEIRETASSITHSSSDIKYGIDDLSARTESQAASIEQTTASMNELTETVKQNSNAAHKANSLAESADKQAQQGGELVNHTVKAMREISTSSNEISNIIEVINEIAFQTNLLALNAAVEAARAGEKGKGFAVVAAEVRQLAQRSANASKDIASLLNDSSTKVEHGMKLVSESGDTLTTIINSIKALSSNMNSIARASSDQATGINQINVAIKQMDGVIQQNNGLVEQANASSNNMALQATRLKELMDKFSI